jgi:hypothetical protein
MPSDDSVEGCCTWTSSVFDIDRDRAYYLDLGWRHGMAFALVQLPPINDNFGASLAKAIRVARFARAIGTEIVVYRANCPGTWGSVDSLTGLSSTCSMWHQL